MRSSKTRCAADEDGQVVMAAEQMDAFVARRIYRCDRQ
jgi:hypothetical protein